MKLKLAAVIEPKDPRWKVICAGLKQAGLRVSPAREVDQLSKEDVVVLGPSIASPSRLSRAVRSARPQAMLFAAQSKGFKAPFADAVLPLPISPNDLRVRLAELTLYRKTSDAQPPPAMRPGEGILDPMTNFYTFAHFKEVLFVEVKRARRYGFPLALALIGFDPLPLTVDEELRGQLMGGLSLAIRRSLRDTDFPVQQAPDRVVLLMPHTDLAGSLIVARRICDRVSKATLQRGDQVLNPTISAGVAAGAPGHEYGFADLVRQATDGLNAALARGGNRVEFVDAVEKPLPAIP